MIETRARSKEKKEKSKTLQKDEKQFVYNLVNEKKN
jgi:hypothetical protein